MTDSTVQLAKVDILFSGFIGDVIAAFCTQFCHIVSTFEVVRLVM